MFAQRSLLGVAAAGLIGLPYLLSSSDDAPNNPSAQADGASLAWLDSAANEAGALPPGTPSPGPPSCLEEIFDFAITPNWILQRWPRVSTTTNQPEMRGYRVPLVTGTQGHDLAGSLTYYFNGKQQLQRIVFHGTTGSAKPLIRLMREKFNFRSQDSVLPGQQRYQVHWHGKPVSELRVQPDEVVDATRPLRHYHVNLLIERPDRHEWFIEGEHPPIELKL